MNDAAPRFATSNDGTRIAYYVEGEGPPLVLSYGALSERRFWTRLAPHLTGYTLYAIERRGRGMSGDAPDYHPEREAEDVVAVLEAIEGPVNIFAHSSGAVVALSGVQSAPQLVRRMVLYEPPMILDNGLRAVPRVDFPERIKALLAAGDVTLAMETFYREGPDLPEADIQRQKAGDLWRSLEPLAHTMVYDAMVPNVLDIKRLSNPTWARPTCLLYGEKSAAWVIDGVKTLAKNLGSSSVVELAGQGHVAMFTAPELLAREIKGFLESE